MHYLFFLIFIDFFFMALITSFPPFFILSNNIYLFRFSLSSFHILFQSLTGHFWFFPPNYFYLISYYFILCTFFLSFHFCTISTHFPSSFFLQACQLCQFHSQRWKLYGAPLLVSPSSLHLRYVRVYVCVSEGISIYKDVFLYLFLSSCHVCVHITPSFSFIFFPFFCSFTEISILFFSSNCSTSSLLPIWFYFSLPCHLFFRLFWLHVLPVILTGAVLTVSHTVFYRILPALWYAFFCHDIHTWYSEFIFFL